jgi:hypothetical protein
MYSAIVKKLVTIFLLVVYSGTVFGEVIDFHQCAGCKPKGIPKHCCKSDLGCLKTDNTPAQQPLILTTAPFHADLILQAVEYPPTMPLEASHADHVWLNPRQKYPQPIYLLIRVFRI